VIRTSLSPSSTISTNQLHLFYSDNSIPTNPSVHSSSLIFLCLPQIIQLSHSSSSSIPFLFGVLLSFLLKSATTLKFFSTIPSHFPKKKSHFLLSWLLLKFSPFFIFFYRRGDCKPCSSQAYTNLSHDYISLFCLVFSLVFPFPFLAW
jgi:hypothetical protein